MRLSTRTRLSAGIVALALVVGLSACSTEETGNPKASNGISITIGSQGTTENEIIAQIYGQALAFEGYDIDYNPGVGSRKQYVKALADGLIDFVPETSGSLLGFLDRSLRYTTTESMVSVMPDLLEKRKLQVLEASPAQNGYSLVVTKAFSQEHNLVNIGDLTNVAASISIGATPEFEGLSYGRSGLASVYGVAGWSFDSIDDETGTEVIQALIDDKVQVAGVHASTSALVDKDLVVLGDPSKIIAEQNVLPLVRTDIASGPFSRLVNSVSAELTTEDLQELNYLSETSTHSAESLARDWLLAHGLLGAPPTS